MTHFSFTLPSAVSLDVIVVVEWVVTAGKVLTSLLFVIDNVLVLLLMYCALVPMSFEQSPRCCFERPPFASIFWHSLSNLIKCLCNTDWCLHSLILSMKTWHSSNKSNQILPLSSSLHVWITWLHTSMVLLICCTLLSSSCFSAFSMIFLPLSVWMFLLSLKLTGVIF